VLVLLAQCAFVRPALAWWNSDWPYRMKIDADTTAKGANIGSALGHVQILLRLHNGNFNFATAKEDGSDLRLVSGDDRTPLHFQIEKFDGLVDQVGLVWIDIPAMAPNAVTSFYLYWGNQKAENGSDGKGTFAGDDVLVYHFADASGPARDTTAYGNNALNSAKRVDGGMIGQGISLDGTQAVQIPATPSLAITAGQATTWSMWVHPDDKTVSGVLYDQKDGAAEFRIGIENKAPYVAVTTASGTVRTPAAPALASGWHLIDVTASDHVALLVDGQPVAQMPGALPALNAAAFLGGPQASAALPPTSVPATPPAVPPGTAPAPAAATPPDQPAPPFYVGLIDEFRIVKNIAPPGISLLRVKSEGPSANLLTLETPQQSSIFGSGYIGIILKSVTPDAWVVIGILGVMSLISWVVMIGKGFYVGRVNKANAVFRAAYRSALADQGGDVLRTMQVMHGNPKPAWRYSSLFRINDIASQELGERRIDEDGTLPARSIAAIRSALDARLVIETQHLNRLMVLLTIAIAGGPFIGLLGTVIGVMITFAAIAQAGDVNVNAIAPGISAALLATVAGLAVAIPALFGYNYFNTRIADAIADMTVHIDSLVTRMGEGLRSRLPQAGE
jgi:biopolymer transport protein ExbB